MRCQSLQQTTKGKEEMNRSTKLFIIEAILALGLAGLFYVLYIPKNSEMEIYGVPMILKQDKNYG